MSCWKRCWPKPSASSEWQVIEAPGKVTETRRLPLHSELQTMCCQTLLCWLLVLLFGGGCGGICQTVSALHRQQGGDAPLGEVSQGTEVGEVVHLALPYRDGGVLGDSEVGEEASKYLLVLVGEGCESLHMVGTGTGDCHGEQLAGLVCGHGGAKSFVFRHRSIFDNNRQCCWWWRPWGRHIALGLQTRRGPMERYSAQRAKSCAF